LDTGFLFLFLLDYVFWCVECQKCLLLIILTIGSNNNNKSLNLKHRKQITGSRLDVLKKVEITLYKNHYTPYKGINNENTYYLDGFKNLLIVKDNIVIK
jgi:hypothetical protein